MITLFTTFFWRRKSEKMTIYVKGPDFNVPVDVDPESKVENIKETIASRFSLDKSDLAIFFSGRILDDFTSIQECNLSQQSVIHVATNCPKTKTHPVNISVERQTTGFYIYCSTCGAEGTPRNGKIRVRCSSCFSGAIELHRDPESWSDVVVPDNILGTCKSCNADTSAEFYFKCCQHNSKSDEAVFLYLIKPNYSQVSCLACTEIKSPMLFPCENGHAMCIQCFENYCTLKITERNFILVDDIGYTVPCPGCPDSFIKEPYHFKILPPHLYERYQRFATEEYVLKNGGVFCPKVNCGEGIFTDESAKVVCTSCRFEFCKMCSREFHEGPCDVQEVRRWSPMSLIEAGKYLWDERASKNTIKRIAKNCPKCKVTTERDGGCMHIQCSRCGFNWCWVCLDEFTSDCRSGHWFG